MGGRRKLITRGQLASVQDALYSAALGAPLPRDVNSTTSKDAPARLLQYILAGMFQDTDAGNVAPLAGKRNMLRGPASHPASLTRTVP